MGERERARRLRRSMSVAEQIFWQRSRNHKLGFEIRRQYPVGVTFSISSARKLCWQSSSMASNTIPSETLFATQA